MDTIKIGSYIQYLRKAAGLTQRGLADKLNISFQAVSKWENGDTLPDTGLLLDLCDILNTTADKLLNGGSVLLKNRKLMRLEDVIIGFENIEDIGKYFGENCDFFTGMVEGVNQKMNIDLLLSMVTEMLEQAFETIPDGTNLILHSDQGWRTIRRC